MGTEKSMKSKDVIDKVNSLWGEEHEEKRKKYINQILYQSHLKILFLFLLYI